MRTWGEELLDLAARDDAGDRPARRARSAEYYANAVAVLAGAGVRRRARADPEPRPVPRGRRPVRRLARGHLARPRPAVEADSRTSRRRSASSRRASPASPRSATRGVRRWRSSCSAASTWRAATWRRRSERFEREPRHATSQGERLGIVIAMSSRGWTRLLTGDVAGGRGRLRPGAGPVARAAPRRGDRVRPRAFVGLRALQGDAVAAGRLLGAAQTLRRRKGLAQPRAPSSST